jgi:hypothetical protein
MTVTNAVASLTVKQQELHLLAVRFERLNTFAHELHSVTKRKRFTVRNLLLWDAMIGAHRMLIIDLSEWIGSVYGWLRKDLQGSSLKELCAGNRKAARATASHFEGKTNVCVEDHERFKRLFLRTYRAALRRLFGSTPAGKGATQQDVLELSTRLEKWREPLKKLRDQAAHAYGDHSDEKTKHRIDHLGRHIRKCGQLLNDLRLLLECSTYGLPTLGPSSDNTAARDVVDLLVLGDSSNIFQGIRDNSESY